jgi:PAS domain S-box-containing protein
MESIESLKNQIQALKDEVKQLKSEKLSVGIAHQKQEDYAETQIRFRTIFENSKLANKIIAPDLKILQINQAMVELLGFDNKEEIIGARILDFVPPEYHAHWRLLQSKLWHKKTASFSLETCLRKKDGTSFWCQVTSILFEDQGQTFGYTILEDISVQHAQKQNRENFISIASHELKTPLTTLQACLQMMNRIILNETTITDKLIKLSESSKQYIGKLSTLVGDLLDSTKISKGQLNLNISRFVFSELVNNCCNHVRLEGKHHITYKGNPNLEISADQQKLDQVLVNLVNNAIKYAPDSLEIIVELEEFNEMVKVSVIDFGPGIAQDKVPFLFDPYYQVKNGKANTQGLGLGLYISSEIIKKHNGKMGVDSALGKGTVFWFTIPQKSSHP